MNRMNDDQSYSGLVQKYIGTAYDTVAIVAGAIKEGWLTISNVQMLDTVEDFIHSNNIPVDLSKPYFTRGLHAIGDGNGGNYIYMPFLDRRHADGRLIIDPTVQLAAQGSGVGEGVWYRQGEDIQTEGPPGLTGDPGIQGEKGDEGEQGPQGELGDPGPDGTDGVDGLKGDQGANGRHGDPGDQGTPGIQGVPGSNGGKGEQGERGLAGIKGDEGAIGPDGPIGPTGPSGSDGPAGNDGTGVDVKGADTVNVIKAKTGAPAGDMWISIDVGTDTGGHAIAVGDGLISDGAGNWTFAGHIEGPVGATGPGGAVGPHGPQGEDGSDGPEGDEGPIGDQGVPGIQGIQGTRGPEGHPGRGIHIRGAVDTLDHLYAITDALDGDVHLVINGPAETAGHLWIYDEDLTRRPSPLVMAPYNQAYWHNVGHVQGPIGPKGDAGRQGVRGLQGIRGPIGAAGPKGATGAKGATGLRGAAGVKGSDGDGNFHSGKTNPANTLGINGDIYVKYI